MAFPGGYTPFGQHFYPAPAPVQNPPVVGGEGSAFAPPSRTPRPTAPATPTSTQQGISVGLIQPLVAPPGVIQPQALTLTQAHSLGFIPALGYTTGFHPSLLAGAISLFPGANLLQHGLTLPNPVMQPTTTDTNTQKTTPGDKQEDPAQDNKDDDVRDSSSESQNAIKKRNEDVICSRPIADSLTNENPTGIQKAHTNYQRVRRNENKKCNGNTVPETSTDPKRAKLPSETQQKPTSCKEDYQMEPEDLSMKLKSPKSAPSSSQVVVDTDQSTASAATPAISDSSDVKKQADTRDEKPVDLSMPASSQGEPATSDGPNDLCINNQDSALDLSSKKLSMVSDTQDMEAMPFRSDASNNAVVADLKSTVTPHAHVPLPLKMNTKIPKVVIKEETLSYGLTSRSEVTDKGHDLVFGVGPPVFPGQDPISLPLGVGPPIFPGVNPINPDPVAVDTTPVTPVTSEPSAMALPVDRSVLEASVLKEDFSCTLCNYQGRSLHCLQKHYKAHTTAYKICRYCGKAFERPSDLIRHEERHLNKDPTARPLFKSPDKGKKLPMSPNKAKMFRCRRSASCTFTTNEQYKLALHYRMSHMEYYSCQTCGMKFISQKSLDAHCCQQHPKSLASQGTLSSTQPPGSDEAEDDVGHLNLSSPSSDARSSISMPQTGRSNVNLPVSMVTRDGHIIEHLSGVKTERGDPVRKRKRKRSRNMAILAHYADEITAISGTTYQDTYTTNEGDFTSASDDEAGAFDGAGSNSLMPPTSSVTMTADDLTGGARRSSRPRVPRRFSPSPPPGQKHRDVRFGVGRRVMFSSIRKRLDAGQWKRRGVFRCSPCNYSTNMKTKFEQHVKAHGGRFVCKICGKVCIKGSDLFRHYPTHGIRGDNGDLICDTCPFTAKRKEDIEEHMKGHYRLAGFKESHTWAKCGICHKTFPRNRLYQHKRQVHGLLMAEIKYKFLNKCSECPATFNTPTKLYQHISQQHRHLIHGDVKSGVIQRPEVKLEGNEESEINAHGSDNTRDCDVTPEPVEMVVKVENVDESYGNCNQISAATIIASVDSTIKEESEVHEISMSSMAREGDKAPPVKRPRIERDPNGYPCTHCGRNFAFKTRLAQHMRTHEASSKRSRKVKGKGKGKSKKRCDICKKSFKAAGYLEQHMLLHTGEKPYVCPCGAAFSLLQSLQAHKRRKCKASSMQAKSSSKGNDQISSTGVGNTNSANEVASSVETGNVSSSIDCLAAISEGESVEHKVPDVQLKPCMAPTVDKLGDVTEENKRHVNNAISGTPGRSDEEVKDAADDVKPMLTKAAEMDIEAEDGISNRVATGIAGAERYSPGSRADADNQTPVDHDISMRKLEKTRISERLQQNTNKKNMNGLSMKWKGSNRRPIRNKRKK